MKKIIQKYFFFLVVQFLCSTCYSQDLPISTETNLHKLISHLRSNTTGGDTMRPFYPYTWSSFKMVPGKLIFLDLKEVVLNSPDSVKFPISYSVIYQGKLVSLFAPGVFVCYSIPLLERDINFEQRINTKRFEKHWIIDNKLLAVSEGKLYFLDINSKWVEYPKSIPVNMVYKLHDDENYLLFSKCDGEFGGTIYFFNKKTKKVHYTEATCANSVIKKDNKYFVLSSLMHMSGSSECEEIAYPDSLPTVQMKDINSTWNDLAWGYKDTSDVAKNVFKYNGLIIYSAFNYNKNVVYLINHEGRSFLAVLEEGLFKIINPLFNSNLWMHGPITSTYDNITLISYARYSTAWYNEVSNIIINDGKLIKIDWNKKR